MGTGIFIVVQCPGGFRGSPGFRTLAQKQIKNVPQKQNWAYAKKMFSFWRIFGEVRNSKKSMDLRDSCKRQGIPVVSMLFRVLGTFQMPLELAGSLAGRPARRPGMRTLALINK